MDSGDFMLDDEVLTENIKKTTGISWNNTGYLVQALTHSSYAHENKHLNMEHNQRLEFLGDAVLELVISDYLYKNHPDYPEGALTKIRAGIVCETSLAAVARQLKLGEHLLMGKGEERSGGRERPSILADVMESLIGAIYLDQGLEVTYRFIIEKLSSIINNVIQNGGLLSDYKTSLQELVQQKSENLLRYKIVDEHGPDHCKTFVANVDYQGKVWGQGTGRTKKEAEQAAARNALEKIQNGNLVLDGEGFE